MWFKRILGLTGSKPAPTVHSPAPQDDPAYQRGAEMARIMRGALDDYLASRYGSLKDDFMGILRRAILADLGQDQFSPLLGVRASVAHLFEETDIAQGKMVSECAVVMSGYRETLDAIGLGGEVQRIIEARVNDLGLEIKLAAVTMAQSFADAARDADEDWRRRHPDRAAEQPL